MMSERGTQGRVEVVTPVASPGQLSSAVREGQDRLWDPVIGPELQTVLESVPRESRDRVREEAWSVLSRCAPPGSNLRKSRTGLVVGYIQSGKTLSYTAVSALAHDNGFRLIIVITGTSTTLLHQTTDRLREDLTAEGWWGQWDILRSDAPEIVSGDPTQVRASLERWNDPAVGEEECRTVLITVMKDRYHLERLITLLSHLDLEDVPSLVVDDEADQASLNIAGPNDEEDSATYRRILTIRRLLPRHSFLQYTATPQAVLLLNLIDQLSPDFGEVLTPGSDYTGGRTFFGDSDVDLVRKIPAEDLPEDPNAPPSSPPDSLLEALRHFFIGVGVGLLNRGRIVKNRSMIVHPTYRVDPHAQYVEWIKQIRRQWTQILALEDGSPDREDLLEDFQEAHEDLSGTVDDLPDFQAIAPKLRRGISETRVVEVNAREGETPQIDWPTYYSWILVGGQALDRGFTVEGLTTSYVPRGLGVRNADTIQQRARWFGYKQDYLGFCRVYLPEASIEAYQDYVEHEEFVRGQLKKHLEEGGSLKDWKRTFILSGALKPTRSSVVRLNLRRGVFRNRWFSPRSPHLDPGQVEANQRVIEELCERMEWSEWSEDPRLRATHRHLSAQLSLIEAAEFMLRFEYSSPTDAARYNGVLVQATSFLEDNPDADCSLFWMRPNETTTRGTDSEGHQISELFGGAWPVNQQEKIYPGDRAVRAEDGLSLQLHNLDVYKGPAETGELVHKDVPALAVWVPEEMATPWLVQV